MERTAQREENRKKDRTLSLYTLDSSQDMNVKTHLNFFSKSCIDELNKTKAFLNTCVKNLSKVIFLVYRKDIAVFSLVILIKHMIQQ